jgi:hypothetical protein
MRLTGSSLTDFLAELGIAREVPVGRSSDSGEQATERQLDELLQRGDPVPPCPGKVPEDEATLMRLFRQAGWRASA